MSAGLGVAAAVGAALFAGWCLAAGPRGPVARRLPSDGSAGAAQPRRRGSGRGWGSMRRESDSPGPIEDLQQTALLVAQLAALLRAGRTPEQVWRQAAETHAASAGPEAGSGERTRSERGGLWQGTEDLTSSALASAAHAAALGRPVAAAIRAACIPDAGAGGRRRATGSASAGVWLSVAACIETAEASGSPLAGVLERLAAQLESDADAAAARAVALAGPRATAQVLSVLPLAGLGLGMLMGADLIGLVLSTPLGSLCLGLGGALTVAGRWWSAQLVRSASEAR